MTAELIKSLTKAQLEMKPPVKDKVGHQKNKYASIDSLYLCLREPMAKNGLSLIDSIERIDGRDILRTTLYHVSGESITTSMPLIMAINPSKPQEQGAAITYARRYAICGIFALPSEVDTDGVAPDEDHHAANANSIGRQNPTLDKNSKNLSMNYMSPAQIQEIDTLIAGDKELLGRMLAGYRKEIPTIQTLSDIPASNYQAIINTLTKRKA